VQSAPIGTNTRARGRTPAPGPAARREQGRRPPAKRSPHVGTLGSTIRIGHSLTIICGKWECHHRATLDLEALAAKLGDDYTIAALVERAVYSECGTGWPDLSLSVSPHSMPKVVGPPSPKASDGD
jgi:hypothetical protein